MILFRPNRIWRLHFWGWDELKYTNLKILVWVIDCICVQFLENIAWTCNSVYNFICHAFDQCWHFAIWVSFKSSMDLRNKAAMADFARQFILRGNFLNQFLHCLGWIVNQVRPGQIFSGLVLMTLDNWLVGSVSYRY